MAKETAESKLLKLIEATEAKEGPTQASGAASPAGASAQAPALKALASVSSQQAFVLPAIFQNLLSLFSPASYAGPGGAMRQVNQALIFIVIIAASYFIFNLTGDMHLARTKIDSAIKQRSFDMKAIELVSPVAVSEYLKVISTRNIFHALEKKEEEQKIVEPIENQKIKDRTANFRLVGISWLSNAQTATAMIEDKATSITSFYKTGDVIQGVKIEVIYADRIEMSFEGEKMTLNL